MCMECDTNFVSDLELKKHFVTQHSTNYRSLVPVPSSKDVPCILCGKSFTGPEAATKHLQTHHETQCDLCDNVFYEMSALHLHMDTCHASVTFPCNLCHSILNTQPELKLHTQEIIPSIIWALNLPAIFVIQLLQQNPMSYHI